MKYLLSTSESCQRSIFGALGLGVVLLGAVIAQLVAPAGAPLSAAFLG